MDFTGADEALLTLLAGNCMTVPAVGAAFFGLLLTTSFGGQFPYCRFTSGIPRFFTNKYVITKGSKYWPERMQQVQRVHF